MNFSASILKSALLPAASLSLGVAGVSLGGVGASGYSFSKVNGIFAGKTWIEDTSKIQLSTNYENDTDPKTLADKNFSCLSRYNKNPSIDVFSSSVQESQINKTPTREETLYNFKNQDFDEGCAFIYTDTNNYIRAEVLLIRESKIKTIFYFAQSTYFHILKIDFENNQVKSKNKIQVNDAYLVEFYQDSKKITREDLFWEKQNSENNIGLTITINSPDASKIKLTGGHWKDRNSYCENMKNKWSYTNDEKNKVEKLCISN